MVSVATQETRKQASVYFREDLHAVVTEFAREEGRTFSQMVERLLFSHPDVKEAVLAERDGAATPRRTDSEAGAPAQDHGDLEVPVASRSASPARSFKPDFKGGKKK